jgi:hypothetical protein
MQRLNEDILMVLKMSFWPVLKILYLNTFNTYVSLYFYWVPLSKNIETELFFTTIQSKKC